MSGTALFEPNWIRWAGATLIGLGIGAVLAFRNPANQEVFVIALGLATLFTRLTFLYQFLFDWEPEYVVSFTAVPCALNLFMSAILFLGRQKAK